jgi:hypothetical protein
MNAIVIEHVKVEDLPEAWRAKFAQSASTQVTVRIEAEDTQSNAMSEEPAHDNLLFGMWRDREDMANVAGYIRSIRASRFNDDGTRQTSD